ncbi:MAG: glycogen debranching protein GlgX [Burkholderiaceae bacterium]
MALPLARPDCHPHPCHDDQTEPGTGPFQVSVSEGRPLPLGVHDCCDGFNFALFSRHATRVEILLFEDADSAEPYAVIDLDPARHRTGDVWHALVDGVHFGHAYGYRVDGRFAPEEGLRFDAGKLLLDPYARAVGGTRYWDFGRLARPSDAGARDAAAAEPAPKCLLVRRRFDWQGVTRPKTSWADTVIYEAHVRGFTAHPSANATAPGTFAGVVEKIPYLRSLGVTALELMPVHEFNQNEIARADPVSGQRLRNYWGYSTIGFFAPKESYATRPGAQVDEFKTMVRELHRAGIEVILDVVFNHTAEGNELGPTFAFRGLDNPIYYLLEQDPRYYRNYSGCGNTLNCNRPVVRDFVIDCLRYWATEMRVDGFRFDLASILGRGLDGNLLANPPLLEEIAEDPVLRDAKLIAEAWDSAGAYQVGSFPGQRWSEWNPRFRDDVRRFWRGDTGMTGALAQRLCGSADVYQRDHKSPVNSVNFVTCHDGFTLADLVSYARKHNEANGEDNRDGTSQNHSANHGVEGPTDDASIRAVRLRQMKNMLATLLLSRGVPMLLGGDEFARSQRGNNNAYCQDNEVSWHDWQLVQRNAELLRFVRHVIALRLRVPVLRDESFYRGDQLRWFGAGGTEPDWDGPARALGCVVGGPTDDPNLCLLFSADTVQAEFVLPIPPAGSVWCVAIDTAADSPHDAAEFGNELEVPAGDSRQVAPRSLVALLSRSAVQASSTQLTETPDD